MKYFTDLRIPEGKEGDWEIKHCIEKKGTKMDVVTMRDAMFGFGGNPKVFTLDDDYLIHKLNQDGGTWMSDCPAEIYTQSELFKNFSGEVLVGGLGLGFAAIALASMRRVTKVTVVEIEQKVIDLVWPHLNKNKIELVHDDLFEYLKRCKAEKKKFDYAFYDIWCPTGERVIESHVWPLREASYGIVPQKRIECWGEPTMLGQIRFSFLTHIQLWNEDAMFPGVHGSLRTIPEEKFKKLADAQPWQSTFLNWMRQTNQVAKTPEQQRKLLAKSSRYTDLIREPRKWKEEWGQWTVSAKKT